MTRFFSAILFLLITHQGFTQDYKRTNVWHFGRDNGLDFNTNPPTTLNSGIVNSVESSASICDTNGILLFYMDNRSIRNKFHQVILNGTGMRVDESCTQGSLIIPLPENDTIFYLFTVEREAGFYYSVINSKGDSGKGEVIIKNRLLLSPVSEKMNAVRHGNGKDFWVFVHGAYNNSFYGFLFTSQGIKPCPVITNIGITFNSYVQVGAMKFSNNAKLLAVATYLLKKVELFDFNNSTGIISNIRVLDSISDPYGLEFSPNNRFLYSSTTRYSILTQFDLSLNTTAQINNSRFIIFDSSASFPSLNFTEALQIGKNHKIYVAAYQRNFLSVINYPDSAGVACGFSFMNLTLPKISSLGLPNFVTSYFNIDSSIDFTYRFLCPSPQAVLTAKFAVSPQWTIRKQNSAANWSYSGNSITHTFDTGTFEVKLKSGTDSISKTITVSPTGQLIIPTDTLKCQVDSIVLTPQNAHWYSCIAWNDTLSVTAIAAKKTGMYKVTAWTTHGCKLSDTIGVRLYKTPPDPLVKSMPDTLYFCKENSVVLSPDSGSSFIWNDGITIAQRTVDTTGLFYTHWIDSFTCVRNDTVRLLNFSYAYSHTLPDTVKFCKGTSVILKSDSGNAFTWNDGYLNATRRIDTAGLFHSHWTDSNTCAQSDNIRLLFYPVTPLQKPLPDSIMFCIGKAITLTPDSGSNFIWNDGITTSQRVVNSAGVFFTAWNDINGCQMADTILVKTYNVAKPVIQRTGDSLFASGNFAQWLWLLNNQPVNGAVQNRYKATQNGWYKVWASDTGLCVAVSDSVNITNVLVNEQTLADAILVFPNPVTGTLYIKSTTHAPVIELALYNVTGQRMLSEKNNSKNLQLEINCTTLPKGIYFLELTTLNQMTCRKKILIR